MTAYPDIRLRRLRQSEAIRRMVAMPDPGPEKFMWPVFIVEGQGVLDPIESMPGQNRMSVDQLIRELEPVVASGIGGVILFGVTEAHKDSHGTYGHREDGVVQCAIREVRREYPELAVFTDVCVCAYTDHGHCGPLDENGNVDNDASLEQLGLMAMSHAAAGAHGVAPSAMMDGQVTVIRNALTEAGFHDTLLMSYSTKFASAMYGPFRDAAASAPGKGDRRGYQADAHDRRTALRESQLDVEEGADMLMVKPALLYLDIIRELRDAYDLPLAAYNVSGEYSMIHATAERGWGDLESMARESITALSRAGADVIISYWANQYERLYGRKGAS